MIFLPLMVAYVTAYHKTTPTATGHRPRAGVCAAPRAYLHHDVVIGGRRYHVEDVSRNGTFDIWLPTRKQCRRWGRKRMHVRLLPPGRRHRAALHRERGRRHAAVRRLHRRPVRRRHRR